MGLLPQRAPAAPGYRAAIGPYRITNVIGQGGTGVVYAAEHVLLGRPVAIKVLLAALSKRRDLVLRFFHEAWTAAATRHPGIVQIFDVGFRPDGAAYIVMERLQGESLARHAARGRLPWQVALPLARQIACALAPLHRKGIIHRALSPENIFLVPDRGGHGGERIKLLDLGFAKLTDEGAHPRMTHPGASIGSPAYMAPEQCRGDSVDHRTDLYALGCVIFKMCAGRPPFFGAGTSDVLAAQIHNPPPRLGALVPGVAPQIESLVERLLAKQPEDRPQSADEVIQQIDAAAHGAPHTGQPAEASNEVNVAGSERSSTTMPDASEAASEATSEAAPEATSEAAPEATSEAAPEATSEAAPEAEPEAPTATTAVATTIAGRGRKAAIWLSIAIVAAAILAWLAVATCDRLETTAAPPPPTAPGGQ